MSQDFFDPDVTHLETAPCLPPAAPTPTEAEMRRDKAREMRDQLAAHMERSAARAGIIPDPEHAHHVSAMRARQEVMTQHGLPDRAWDDAPGITGHDKIMLEVVVKEAVRESEARITKKVVQAIEARLDAWEERLLARVGDRLLECLDARMDARLDVIAQARGARETTIEDVLDSIGDPNSTDADRNASVEPQETFETLMENYEPPVQEEEEALEGVAPVQEETPHTNLDDALIWDDRAPFVWRHREKPVWRMMAICLGHPGVKGGFDKGRLIFASVDGRWGVSIPQDAWHEEANDGWAWEHVTRGLGLLLHWPESYRGMSGRIEPERAVRIEDLSIVRETKDAHAVYVKTRSGIATYLDLNVITASTSPVEVGGFTTVWALPSRMRMGKRSKGWLKMITRAEQTAARHPPTRDALVGGVRAASETVAKAAGALEGEVWS